MCMCTCMCMQCGVCTVEVAFLLFCREGYSERACEAWRTQALALTLTRAHRAVAPLLDEREGGLLLLEAAVLAPEERHDEGEVLRRRCRAHEAAVRQHLPCLR